MAFHAAAAAPPQVQGRPVGAWHAVQKLFQFSTIVLVMSVNWLIFMTKKMNQFKGNRYKKETALTCLLLVSERICAESAMRVGKGSHTWAWPGLLSIETERERQLYGGGGSRRAYWKKQAHQISRNIELK